MKKEEMVELLKTDVEGWNKWRGKVDLSRTKLSGANLTGANLVDADLSGANMVDADLSRADLSGANLSGADLSGADLVDANLSGADLFRANLTDANLFRANLSGANLSGANLIDANLTGANLTGAILYDAHLTDAHLAEADLSGTNLSRANLSRANLSLTNLSGADLVEAYLIEANLFGTDLSHTNLFGANLSSAILIYTILTEANLDAITVGGTVFGLTNLSTVKGLDTVVALSHCTIDFQTLRSSKNIPRSFLKKIGLPDLFIDYLPEFYMDAINFYPVFLSHSWANKDFARKLYEALIAKGVNVFFDEKKMKPGDDIYESLSKGISHFDKMILVCSKESLQGSWWVDRELDRLLAKERELMKERGKRINLLIPVTIDDYVHTEWDGAKTEDVKRYVIGDFTQWQDEAKFEQALNDLVHALNADRPDITPTSLL